MEPRMCDQEQRRRGVSIAHVGLSYDIKDSDLEGAMHWLNTGCNEAGPNDLEGVLQVRLPPVDVAPELQRAARPGEYTIRCEEAPSAVREALHRFFQQELADTREVSKWTLRGTVFLEFIGLAFEASVYSGPARSAATVLLTDKARCDSVRFSRLVAAAAHFLTQSGLKVTSEQSTSAMGLDFDEFDFDEELDSDEARDWDVCVGEVLREVGHSSASERQECLQLLASWGQQHASSRAAIARGLIERRRFAAMVLSSQVLCEVYPLVAAIKYAALCTETVVELATSLQKLLASSAPAQQLVKSEVDQALELMQASSLPSSCRSPCGTTTGSMPLSAIPMSAGREVILEREIGRAM